MQQGSASMKCLGYLVAAMLASGCVEVERYPENWPARASVIAGSCPDISGQYGFAESERPLNFESERTLRVLHELAGFQRMYPVPNKVKISHRQDPWVSIEVFVENTSTLTREFIAQDATIRCDASGLFIKPPPLEQVFSGGGQTIRRELLFSSAEDGSLVFRQKYTATSRVVGVPVAGFGITWHRLERVSQ